MTLIAPLAISSCLISALQVMLLIADAQLRRTTGHSVLARSINAGITPSSASWTWFPCKIVFSPGEFGQKHNSHRSSDLHMKTVDGGGLS